MTDTLGHYPNSQRNRLQACAALSDRIAQLAQSHPLLFFALATAYGPAQARCEAVRLAERGSPLRNICAVMGIPYALRRITPAALGRPLTEAWFSERAGQLLASRIDRTASSSHRIKGLATAFYGARICDDRFGIWLADPRHAAALKGLGLEQLRALALYAWSSRPEAGLPSSVCKRPWTAHMGWHTAVSEARLWVNHLKFYFYFGSTSIADGWAEAASVDGFEFVPLTRFDALIEEVAAMQNCLNGYADRLLANQCRLFGVRRDGFKIGTVEIQPRSPGSLRISEFRGPKNARMPFEAWHAAHAWIEQQRPVNTSRFTAPHSPAWQHQWSDWIAHHAKMRKLQPEFWRTPPTLQSLAAELSIMRGTRPTRYEEYDQLRRILGVTRN